MRNLIQQFISFRQAEGLAKTTIKDYTYHLSRLADLVEKSEVEDSYRDAVLSYLSDAQNPNTYNIRYKYMKKFFNWCLIEEVLDCQHPLRGLKKRRPQNRIVHINDEDIAKLLALPDKTTFAGYRNFCIMLFSLDVAVRPSETLQLKENDFNFSNLLVNLPAEITKTRRAAILPISIQTAIAIRKLLEYHDKNWKNPTVFCSESGGKLRVQSWSNRLKKYGKEIGVHVTAYSLRHVACLGMLKSGMDLVTLSSVMTHSDISTTKIYLNISLDDVQEQHSKYSLLNKVAPIQGKRVRKVA